MKVKQNQKAEIERKDSKIKKKASFIWLQLGNSYHPGVYIAQFLQGTDKVSLRLIKEGK